MRESRCTACKIIVIYATETQLSSCIFVQIFGSHLTTASVSHSSQPNPGKRHQPFRLPQIAFRQRRCSRRVHLSCFRFDQCFHLLWIDYQQHRLYWRYWYRVLFLSRRPPAVHHSQLVTVFEALQRSKRSALPYRLIGRLVDTFCKILGFVCGVGAGIHRLCAVVSVHFVRSY